MTSLVVIVVALALYLLPAAIASARHHRNAGPIFIVNLVFGWTLIGWVVCLAWAFSHQPQPGHLAPAASGQGYFYEPQAAASAGWFGAVLRFVLIVVAILAAFILLAAMGFLS